MASEGTFLHFILAGDQKIYSGNNVLCKVRIEDNECEMWVPASSLEDELSHKEAIIPDEEISKEIWCSRKPKPHDIKATEDLLNIIKLEDIQRLLMDKKTPKYKVWENISLKLQENHGYVVGKCLKDAGIKCHQKWRNLEKGYMTFIQNSKKTGTGNVKTPEYFDLLYSILGKKTQSKTTNFTRYTPIRKFKIN